LPFPNVRLTGAFSGFTAGVGPKWGQGRGPVTGEGDRTLLCGVFHPSSSALEGLRKPTMQNLVRPHDVISSMSFIKPDSKINRRYITPGLEVNTGRYEVKNVHIRDARPYRTECTLETTGFELSEYTSEVCVPIEEETDGVGHRFYGYRTN